MWTVLFVILKYDYIIIIFRRYRKNANCSSFTKLGTYIREKC